MSGSLGPWYQDLSLAEILRAHANLLFILRVLHLDVERYHHLHFEVILFLLRHDIRRWNGLWSDLEVGDGGLRRRWRPVELRERELRDGEGLGRRGMVNDHL